MITREAYAVYLVTDEPSRYTGDFVEAVDAAISGGVTLVQYRDTESDDRTMYMRALRLRGMLRERGIPLIINNSPALALAVSAEGVHVGQSDLPTGVVRRIVGPKMSIGLSITCLADVETVCGADVDHVGIGPVYDAKKTKHDAAPEMGLEGFSAIRQALASYPAVAIGGITLAHASAVYAAGADGLAIVSALSQAESPMEAARGFRKCFEESGFFKT